MERLVFNLLYHSLKGKRTDTRLKGKGKHRDVTSPPSSIRGGATAKPAVAQVKEHRWLNLCRVGNKQKIRSGKV